MEVLRASGQEKGRPADGVNPNAPPCGQLVATIETPGSSEVSRGDSVEHNDQQGGERPEQK